jgi:thiamine kinase-like enzyme
MAAYDEAAVRAALRRVWPDPATADTAKIRALSGGLSPRSFLAVAGKRRYVLRVPTPGAVPLLDLETEVRAMRAAAAAGVAPAVVGVDEVEGLLLTEHRVAVPWVPEMARRSLSIARVTPLLRALHAVVVDVPVFAAERIAREYLATLEVGGGPTLARTERSWADELLRLARRYDMSCEATAFCHNDLVAANVLDDGAALLLVDFEYAVRSAPLLDLASLAGMNDYTDAQRRELLSAYYGDSVTAAATTNDLDNAVRMVRLLALFWARLGERRGGRKDVYAQLAAHLCETLK